ncbi:MAG: ATP-binding protein [Clostridium fessum]
MRFLDLYISGFGKFRDTAVSFEDGLNVIYGKNEAGKSTIHTFIRGMLFGIERQRGAPPETTSTANMSRGKTAAPTRAAAQLESDDGTIYRIERSFQKNKKEFTVINETTGREEPDGRAVLQEILGGMSETMYNNTISISQLKSATDEGMVSELKNYIAQHEYLWQYGAQYH